MEQRNEVLDGRMLWKILSGFFMNELEIIVSGSVYRSGVLLNYKTVSDQYRLKFKGDVKILSIPTPFQILIMDDVVYLDFRMETFTGGDKTLINTLEEIEKTDVSPFFDKLVIIKVVK